MIYIKTQRCDINERGAIEEEARGDAGEKRWFVLKIPRGDTKEGC